MIQRKSFKIALFTILLIMFTSFAYAAPVKKTPAKEGNFEIITGARLIPPIDTKLMQASIIKAATNLGWIIEKNEPEIITLKLEKPRAWWVVIKVCYTTDEYWYEYVDSYNLDANPAKNKIHRNYTNRWIPNLEKHIYAFYTNPNAKPRPTVISQTKIATDFTNVKGTAVITPIDTEKFKNAAVKAATDLGWQVLENKNGEISIRYSRNNWWVVTKIVYSKDGYNYIYKDSYNLDANVEKKRIHKNYLGRWIPNLEKNIAVNYF